MHTLKTDITKRLSEITQAKVVAVGDDWQSIYAFSGSDITLFTRFLDLMGAGTELKITHTYTTPSDITGWTEIDEGTGDRYNLCQSNYFPGGLYTDDGIPRYNLRDGKPMERTEDEIQADRAAIVPPPQAPGAEDMTAVLSLARRQDQELSDAQALEVPVLYPYWAPGIPYGGEGKIQIVRRPVEGREQLYRCGTPHTSQTGWEPENVPAVWTAINQTNKGTMDDPIPAARGMEYTYGKYYEDPEDGKIYLCKRTGEADGGTVTLQFLPHELVGHYFEAA